MQPQAHTHTHTHTYTYTHAHYPPLPPPHTHVTSGHLHPRRQNTLQRPQPHIRALMHARCCYTCHATYARSSPVPAQSWTWCVALQQEAWACALRHGEGRGVDPSLQPYQGRGRVRCETARHGLDVARRILRPGPGRLEGADLCAHPAQGFRGQAQRAPVACTNTLAICETLNCSTFQDEIIGLH